MTRLTALHARLLACSIVVAVFTLLAAVARAEQVAAVLDLVAATANENTFNIRVEALGDQDAQSVIYTGVVRPLMDIDFTNPAAPVVSALDFTGVVSDLAHTDAVFTLLAGTATFTNITGRVETPAANRPAPVSGGVFSSSGHQLIAWSGTIDVAPIVGSATQINLMTHTFTGTFNGTDNSSIAVALNAINGGMATYDVDVTAVLDDVLITTGDPTIDNLISIFITGNVVAEGQFTRAVPVPEPTAGIQALLLIATGVALRRARGRRQ